MNTALMARWRVHHVPMEKLRDQMAGSYIGRLCLSHLSAGGDELVGITLTQYDAAQAYMADLRAYHVAIDAPKQMGAIDLNAVHGRSHHENVKRSEQAIVRFLGANKDGSGGATGAIRDAQMVVGNRGNLYAAMELCVIKDVDLHHMVGDVRLALNALARHYGLGNRRAA